MPHSDPPHRPDVVERYSYGWCNGPSGDAQAFRLLARVTGDAEWDRLGDACWHTVRESGLPQRIRPGFWDNNGQCCGTAGVLATACDRVVERGDDLSFATVLVDDLTARATVDADGARWSNVEHRVEPSVLEPRPGWAMGNAGILRELLRYVRIGHGGDSGYAVTWPDQPRVGPRGATMVSDPPRGRRRGESAMAKRRWSDLSDRNRRFIVIAGVCEAVLKIAALVDLRRRPAAQVRGSKKVWAGVIVLANSLGAVPVAYFLLGRRRSVDG